MKKKYNNYGKAVAVTILLAVAFGVFPLAGNAQENDSPLYAIVDCMKVKPENEERYLELERTIFKPLHLQRAKQGNIVGWFLYKVWFTGTDDCYNYVTVTLFDNPAKVEDPWKNMDFAKLLPGKDIDAMMKRTNDSRILVKSELWEVVDKAFAQ